MMESPRSLHLFQNPEAPRQALKSFGERQVREQISCGKLWSSLGLGPKEAQDRQTMTLSGS